MKPHKLAVLTTIVTAISSFYAYSAIDPAAMSTAQDTIVFEALNSVTHTFVAEKNLTTGTLKGNTIVGKGKIETENGLTDILAIKFIRGTGPQKRYIHAREISNPNIDIVVALLCDVNLTWDCNSDGALTTKGAVSLAEYYIISDDRDQTVFPGNYLVSLQAGKWAS